MYIFLLARTDGQDARAGRPRIVRIPRVYDAFTMQDPGRGPFMYIVMEYMDGDDCAVYTKAHPDRTEALLAQIDDAVRHIWDLPPPPGITIGPLGQQIPADRFFSDCGADRRLDNVVQLQDWVNAKLEEAGRLKRAALQHERICICHNDLTEFNIRVTTSGAMALLDWGFAGVYPHVFEEFAVVNQFNLREMKFARALHGQLFGPKVEARAAARAGGAISCLQLLPRALGEAAFYT